MPKKFKFDEVFDDDVRSQRDLFTVVKCMLCIIPESAITLREDLEELAVKLSFPSREDLVYLDKEIALILYDRYEEYKKYTWMQIVIALFFNRNVTDVLEVFKDSIDDTYNSTDINNVKVLCDKGIFETLINYNKEEDSVHVRLRDTYRKKSVTIGVFQNTVDD